MYTNLLATLCTSMPIEDPLVQCKVHCLFDCQIPKIMLAFILFTKFQSEATLNLYYKVIEHPLKTRHLFACSISLNSFLYGVLEIWNHGKKKRKRKTILLLAYYC